VSYNYINIVGNSSDSFNSDIPWSFGLVVKAGQGTKNRFQYTPRSDFSLSIDGFPHVILEISSDKIKKRDHNRMLLQASCLVRLGNMLIADKSSTFFIKAIYIDHDFTAIEYTLFQSGSDNEVFFFRLLLRSKRR
jgi:hypothetical protein